MKTPWPKLPNMKVPLFDNGTVYLCRDFEEWKAAHAAANLPVDDDLQYSSGLCRYIHHAGKRRFLVCINSGSLATLTHELAHVAFDVCGLAGVPCKEGEGNETFCYLMGAMMDKFAGELSK